MPILAERAAEIAACESRRKNFSTGLEMIKGLFLNGVDREAGNESVKWNVRLPVRVKPYPALALFSGSEKAAPGTEDTLYLSLRQRSKEAGATHDRALSAGAKRAPDGREKGRRFRRFSRRKLRLRSSPFADGAVPGSERNRPL